MLGEHSARSDHPGYHVLERRDADGEVSQRGMLGALSLRGVETGHVVRHQQVGERHVALHARLLRQRGLQADGGAPPAPGAVEPLLLAAHDLGPIQEYLDAVAEGPADHERVTPDGGVQRLWACDARWLDEPPALPPVLLADGHHRLEAARRLRREHPGAAADTLLALVVDHSRYPLTLSATHRVVRGLDVGKAIRTASRIARVVEHPPGARPLPRRGTFVLTGGGQAWEVSEVSAETVAGRLRSLPPEWVELPAAISDHVIIPAICEDQGVEPSLRYTSQVPYGADLGLVLPPPTWDQIWSGAANGTGMPPKSTCLGPAPEPVPVG
ncbi:DUF1015 family protein [Streptomyces sp. 4N509B]|uniref:DUF1015 family protein n=1 Tax=Streptomyces sp. 4N509B TaxID=3457413 RepID=UPI003FD0561E